MKKFEQPDTFYPVIPTLIDLHDRNVYHGNKYIDIYIDIDILMETKTCHTLVISARPRPRFIPP